MAKMTSKEADKLGLPDGFEIFSPFPFAGMNLESDRIGMADQEFYELTNMLKIGDGRLIAVLDNAPPLYTAPSNKTIISFFWFNIGSSNACAVFLSDGTAVQVSTTGVVTTISSVPGTFYKSGAVLPACSQWGTQYLLIASNFQFSAYWVWDGSTLYAPGTVGPYLSDNLTTGGSNYTSAPTVTAFGGAGSGVEATATVEDGSVVSLKITNPGSGYIPGDVVQLQFAGGGSDNGAVLKAVLASGSIDFVNVLTGGSGYVSPTVTFTGGGGSGAAATATVSGGAITAVTLTSGGSGYTGTPVVGFTGSSGSGATAAALLTAGKIASVTVVSGGTNFTSTPTLTTQGGGGSGATLTAVLSGKSISSVTVVSGGSGFVSVPAVIVGPGANNAAGATLSLMPSGVSGSAIETYESRVWLAVPYTAPGATPNNGTIQVSAPGAITDFATSDGASTFVTNEPFLRQTYVALKQTNGFLYPIGDSAVDIISNVSTSGSPSTTTFTYQNIDPQTGAAWRDTAQYYGLSVIFANTQGIFGLYGGAVKKISKKITTLIQNAIFPPTNGAVTPCSSVVNIGTIKLYVMLLTVIDPVTNLPRNAMVGWDEQNWYIFTQTVLPSYIGTQVINSNYTAWGTDGSTLYQMFNTQSSTLEKTISTKLYGANSFPIIKNAMGLWLMAQDTSTNTSGVTFTGTIDTENGSVPLAVSPLSFGGQPMLGTDPGNSYGAMLGITLNSTSPSFELRHFVIGYRNFWGGYGDPPALAQS